MENDENREKVEIILNEFKKVGELLINKDFWEAKKLSEELLNQAVEEKLHKVVSNATKMSSVLDFMRIMQINPEGALEIPRSFDFMDLSSEFIQYEIGNERIVISIFEITYIGNYPKSSQLKIVLDDFHNSLKGFIDFPRDKLQITDDTTLQIVSETEKLKNLEFLHKENIETKKQEELENRRKELEEKRSILEQLSKELHEKIIEHPVNFRIRLTGIPPELAIRAIQVDLNEPIKEIRKRAWLEYNLNPILLIQFIFQGKVLPDNLPIGKAGIDFEKDIITVMATGAGGPAEPAKSYDINMGFQYYSVMMEQQAYMFYVYFNRDELRIEDEEGKTVYQTKIQVSTTRKGSPKFDISIKGKGFNTHPIFGQVQVKKKQQAMMNFSVTPKKSKGEQNKLGEKRFLQIKVEFENKIVNHTIIAIHVQPKHFSLKLGPVELNLSKTQAMVISFVPILITVISTIYSIISFDFSGASTSSSATALEAFIPGASSLVFLVSFILLVLKKGVFPIKEKVEAFLDFDKVSMKK